MIANPFPPRDLLHLLVRCHLARPLLAAVAAAGFISGTRALLPVIQAAGIDQGAGHTDIWGDPLPERALFRSGTMHYRHPDGINAAALSPDGKRLATAGALCICIWDLDSGRCLRVLRDCDVAIGTEKGMKLAFSPDGKCLAHVCRYDVSARLWDVGTGKLIRTFGALPPKLPLDAQMGFAAIGPFDGANSLFFSRDGKTLVVCSAIIVSTGATITCYDVTSGTRLKKITIPGEPLGFSADERVFCTFPDKSYRPDNSRLLFCSAETGAVRRELKIKPAENGRFARAAFAPDGRCLALAGGGARLRVVDIKTGNDVSVFDGPERTPRGSPRVPFTSLCYSEDGKLLFAGTESGFIGRYAVVSGEELPPLENHPVDTVTSLAVANGKTLVACSWDATIRRWDIATGKPLPLPAGPISRTHAAVSPDGARIAAADTGAGRLELWDARTGKRRQELQASGTPICAVAFGPDAKFLATGCGDDTVRLWDLRTSGQTSCLSADRSPDPSIERWVHLLRISPGGRRLVAGLSDNRLVCWEVPGGKRVWTVPAPGALAAAYSPDGRLVLSGGWDSHVRFCDAATGQERRNISVPRVPESRGAPTFVDSIDFSPAGRLVATAHHDGLVRLWNLDTGTITRRLPCHDDAIFSVRFSSDGAWLVTGGVDGIIRVWEVATGKQLLELKGSEAWVEHAEFSPDDRTILSAGGNQVLMWSTRPDESTAGDLASMWKRLASADARQAYAATWALAARPAEAVTFLRSKLAPIPPANGQRLRELIHQLDSPRFAEREDAVKRLAQLGGLAEAALREAATKSPSPEAAPRLQALLDNLARGYGPTAARDLRAVQALRLIGTPEARTFLRTLSGGGDGAPLTEAARLALKALHET